MKTILMNTESIQANAPPKLVLSLPEKLRLKRPCSSKIVYLLHVENYKTTV